MVSLWLTVLLTCVAAFTAYFGVYKRGRAAKDRLPPGPPSLPILGNVLDFPRQHLGKEFRAISQKYGDVVHLNILGRSFILLGSYEVACELLEKRSTNYSDRPPSVMVKLTNLDWIFVFKNYDSEWRQHRRLLHQQLQPSMLPRYEPTLLQVTKNHLCDLLRSPEDFSLHIKSAFAAVVLREVYGVDPIQGDSKYYKLVQRLAIIAEEISTPGRHPVEAFQSMQHLPSWFPGTGFRKLAANWKLELASIRDQLFESAREKMGDGESIMARLIEAGEDEKVIRDVAATIYAAGADTAIASVHAFFLAMALNPGAQKKVQEELDATIGPNRLPRASDRTKLPYMTALMKEVLRWHIVAPIGVPRRSVKDDLVNGFVIPGGSIVIANAWAMSQDGAMYSHPEQFRPERFLKDGVLNPNVRDPGSFAFGFGRRVCPGRPFAEEQLFIMCASILHVFNISPPLDNRGVPKKLDDVHMGYDLAVSHLEPFECCITIRDARKEELVQGTVTPS